MLVLSAGRQLLGELSDDPSLVAISVPIDYWDYLGWKDTLADPHNTARQKAYAHVRGDGHGLAAYRLAITAHMRIGFCRAVLWDRRACPSTE